MGGAVPEWILNTEAVRSSSKAPVAYARVSYWYEAIDQATDGVMRVSGAVTFLLLLPHLHV